MSKRAPVQIDVSRSLGGGWVAPTRSTLFRPQHLSSPEPNLSSTDCQVAVDQDSMSLKLPAHRERNRKKWKNSRIGMSPVAPKFFERRSTAIEHNVQPAARDAAVISSRAGQA